MVIQSVQITKLYLTFKSVVCVFLPFCTMFKTHSVTRLLCAHCSQVLPELSTPDNMKDYEVHINSRHSCLCFILHSECQ